MIPVGVVRKKIIGIAPGGAQAVHVVSVSDAHQGKGLVLMVVDGGQVVGISTTNDFFYKIVNPILGLGTPGTRIEVIGAGSGKGLEEVISTVNKQGLEIVTLHIEMLPDKAEKDICIHVDSNDVKELVNELKSKGYKVNLRKR